MRGVTDSAERPRPSSRPSSASRQASGHAHDRRRRGDRSPGGLPPRTRLRRAAGLLAEPAAERRSVLELRPGTPAPARRGVRRRGARRDLTRPRNARRRRLPRNTLLRESALSPSAPGRRMPFSSSSFRRALCVAGAGLLVCSVAGAGGLSMRDVSVLAGACVNCHGPDDRSPGAIPALGGLAEARLRARMLAFRDDKVPDATVMPRLMKAFDDDQIDALARWFARGAGR
ncbi:MAG: hypothetical protein MZW92_74580 [Comamonadaceae bacterium]|nr:hypothetical protein [Comamonadaceae bacterium]